MTRSAPNSIATIDQFIAQVGSVKTASEKAADSPLSEAGSIGGTIDGYVEVELGVFDQHLPRLGQPNLQVATLVRAAARSVHVRQADAKPFHLRFGPAECEVQPALGMRAQGRCEVEPQRADVELHRTSPVVLPTGRSLGVVNTSDKSNIVLQ